MSTTTTTTDTAGLVNPDPLYSVAAAAAYLGITRQQAYTLVNDGHLPVVRISARNLRVRLSALEDYIRRATRPATRA